MNAAFRHSNMKSSGSKSSGIKSSGIKLSIGMIVKNEEKYLRRCLTAIKPLLEQVSSELIIVDTGSTDTTVDIAKEFTDKVYFFKWCDDFSAARNETVRYSKGEWFMFLDADEIFEDVSEIVNFFNSGEYKKYNSASHLRHEIMEDSTNIATVTRLSAKNSGFSFHGLIHEAFCIVNPIKFFDSFSNHYGYEYINDPGKKRLKHERNLRPLLKEHEKDPTNLRVLVHLIQEYQTCGCDDPEALKYIDIMCELAKKNPYDSFAIPAYYRRIVQYHMMGDIPATLRFIDEYFDTMKASIATNIDIYYFRGVNYKNDSQWENSIIAFKKSLELFDLLNKGELDKRDLLFNNSVLSKEKYTENLSDLISVSYGKLNDDENAFLWLEVAKCNDIEAVERYMKLALKSGHEDKLAGFYHELCNLGNENYVNVFTRNFEKFVAENRFSENAYKAWLTISKK